MREVQTIGSTAAVLRGVDPAPANGKLRADMSFTLAIGEGEAVVKAIAKYDRIFRINTWFRFQDGFYGAGSSVAPIRTR